MKYGVTSDYVLGLEVVLADGSTVELNSRSKIRIRFSAERRGVEFTLEPWMKSDAGATYSEVLRVDCGALSPMVAAARQVRAAMITLALWLPYGQPATIVASRTSDSIGR